MQGCLEGRANKDLHRLTRPDRQAETDRAAAGHGWLGLTLVGSVFVGSVSDSLSGPLIDWWPSAAGVLEILNSRSYRNAAP